MIRVTKALSEEFYKHVTNLSSGERMHVGLEVLAMGYAMDYVDSQIDRYLVDDNTVDNIASQIAKELILTLKRKIDYNERKYGICLF